MLTAGYSKFSASHPHEQARKRRKRPLPPIFHDWPEATKWGLSKPGLP